MPCLLHGLLERRFSAERLDRIFLENAQEQYTRELLFSTVCELLLGVVLKIHPSVHAAHQKRPEPAGATVSALYEKLKNAEFNVSQALLRDASADLSAILDVFPCEDGHANERSLLGAAARIARAGELWIAGRNFCTLGYLRSISEPGAFAVAHLHKNLPFSEDAPLAFVGEDRERRIFEQKVTADGRQYRRVRVQLAKPTRDGGGFLDILAGLPPEIPAATAAALCRRRWTGSLSPPARRPRSPRGCARPPCTSGCNP